MDKVNEDFKTGKGLPDVLKGYGPNKLKRSTSGDGERWTPASMTDELRAVACM